MTKPNELGVRAIAEAVRDGRLTAADVVAACLDRIEARDHEVHAWTDVRREQAILAAKKVPSAHTARLAGVPFGVKDVIDAEGHRCGMGSSLYDGWEPRFDAGCVGFVRSHGAVMLGKTATAEFAGTFPPTTRNPLNTDHTPGGSSSGSAAAVADFMVPFAFGTQTGGSVLRPAAFCGIVGFKPTFGSYSPAGMKPAAHSFDTIGTMARNVGDIALVHATLMNQAPARARATAPRIGIFPSRLWPALQPDMAARFEDAAARLQARGAKLVEIDAGSGFGAITEERAVINAYERARAMAGEWRENRASLSDRLAQTCERGLAIDGDRYLAARRAVEDFRDHVKNQFFLSAEILMTPTTPGEAPVGISDAGDPRLQEIWTMLHLPAITVPAGRGASGLPLGVQFVAPRFEDAALLSVAEWAEPTLAER